MDSDSSTSQHLPLHPKRQLTIRFDEGLPRCDKAKGTETLPRPMRLSAASEKAMQSLAKATSNLDGSMSNRLSECSRWAPCELSTVSQSLGIKSAYVKRGLRLSACRARKRRTTSSGPTSIRRPFLLGSVGSHVIGMIAGYLADNMTGGFSSRESDLRQYVEL
jgi:hypothetical protein